MRVVENEGGDLSEALYVDNTGLRAPFTAERPRDGKQDKGITGPAPPDNGMDTVLLIQIPLDQTAPPVTRTDDGNATWASASGTGARPGERPARSSRGGVHGASARFMRVSPAGSPALRG